MPGPCANRYAATPVRALFLILLIATPALGQERQPFQKGSAGIEFGVAPMVEIWNINEEHEEIIEGTASFWGGLSDRVAVGLEFHHAFVLQKAPGAFVRGVSSLVRVKLTRRPHWNWYVESGPGVSWSDLPAPVRGTKFNYLFQAGTGVVRPVSSNSHVIIGYRFFHLSNHGRIGKDHNPDFEMMGLYAGWSVSF
jgi:hypothetical protein